MSSYWEYINPRTYFNRQPSNNQLEEVPRNVEANLKNDQKFADLKDSCKERLVQYVEETCLSCEAEEDVEMCKKILDDLDKLSSECMVEPHGLVENDILKKKLPPEYREHDSVWNARVFDWLLKGILCIFKTTDISEVLYLASFIDSPAKIQQAKQNCEILLNNLYTILEYLRRVVIGIDKIDYDLNQVKENAENALQQCNAVIVTLVKLQRRENKNTAELARIFKEIEENYFKLSDAIHRLPKRFREEILGNKFDEILQKLESFSRQ